MSRGSPVVEDVGVVDVPYESPESEVIEKQLIRDNYLNIKSIEA